MENIASNLQAVIDRIRTAETRFGREPGSVRLLAVSKTHSPGALRAAVAAGQRDFGENYLQEALSKIAALGSERLIWHYIGPVQSNKTRQLAENFHWLHSLDREKIAHRLSAARPPGLPPLNVCIQVNISNEASKSGVAPTAVADLANIVTELPGLHLRGLMVIPAPGASFDRQRAAFARSRALYDELTGLGLSMDTLSMGMSDDLEAAVAEGSNLVRVGTAIFGQRRA